MALIRVINYEIDDAQIDDKYHRSIWLNTESRPILLPINTEVEFNEALEILKNKNVIYDSEAAKLIMPS